MKTKSPSNQRLLNLVLILALLAGSTMTWWNPSSDRSGAIMVSTTPEVDFTGLYEIFSPYCSDTMHVIEIAPMGTPDWYWISNFNGADTVRVFCKIMAGTLHIPTQALPVKGQEVMITGGGFRSGEAIDIFFSYKPSQIDYVHECHLSGRELGASQLFAYSANQPQR
ncbi:MAG: hypothetical protein R3301_11250 [Saprospiraceae bacterium]|nr:hypothetical protein [Saprospiraceae bacterium]